MSTDELTSTGDFSFENVTDETSDVRILISKIAEKDWFIELKDSSEKREYIIDKVRTFCALSWVKQLDDEQRYECFLGYLQYEFLKQGLRRQDRARDFVFYGFAALGTPSPTLPEIAIDRR